MWILSAAAIVLGLIAAIADVKLFMPPLEWFVLAIAIALLRPSSVPFLRNRT